MTVLLHFPLFPILFYLSHCVWIFLFHSPHCIFVLSFLSVAVRVYLYFSPPLREVGPPFPFGSSLLPLIFPSSPDFRNLLLSRLVLLFGRSPSFSPYSEQFCFPGPTQLCSPPLRVFSFRMFWFFFFNDSPRPAPPLQFSRLGFPLICVSLVVFLF